MKNDQHTGNNDNSNGKRTKYNSKYSNIIDIIMKWHKDVIEVKTAISKISHIQQKKRNRVKSPTARIDMFVERNEVFFDADLQASEQKG